MYKNLHALADECNLLWDNTMAFVRVIARVGCCGLRLWSQWSAYGEPSESVVGGEVGSSRPPIIILVCDPG